MDLNKLYLLFLTGLLIVSHTTYAQDIEDSVRVYFREGHSTLEVSINDNKEAIDRIADSLANNYTDTKYRLRHVTVIGGSSPDGTIRFNKRLSERRANNLFDHVSRYGDLSSSDTTFIYLGRDWTGLLYYVKNDPKVPYRDEVISLIEEIIAKSADGEKSYHNNVGRLGSLRGSIPYIYMYWNIFPKLRSSRLILSYDKIWLLPHIASLKSDAFVLAPSLSLHTADRSDISSAVAQPARRPFYMSVKTNLFSDAALIPDVGVEFYLGRNYSVAANWHYSWWDNNRNWYWRTYGGDISVRRWFGRLADEKPLTGHHAGLYAQTSTYDFMWGKKGYMAGEPEGNIFDSANYAVGAEYGYSLPVAKRLNLDFTLGAGYMWGKYYEYIPVDGCYVWQATKKRRWIGPTKAEISLVWLLGRDNVNTKKGGRR